MSVREDSCLYAILQSGFNILHRKQPLFYTVSSLA